jgi:murein DD-endopeptidase MepM/ murein hydrolase activator NlpD
MALRTADDDQNIAQKDADRKVSGALNNRENQAADKLSGEDRSVAISKREKDGAGHSVSLSPKVGPMSVKAKKKRGGPIAVIISLFSVLAIGSATLPTLGPIAFVENVFKDLDDQLAALDIGRDKLFRNKLPSKDKAELIKGCTKLSIRCKFATLSNRQVKKLESQGIKITASESKNILGMKRVIPENVNFNGQDYSAENFSKELNTNREASNALRRANNMTFLGMSDGSFMTNVLKRFGITKKPTELSGRTTKERVSALLKRTIGGTASDITLLHPKQVNESITEVVDSKGKTIKVSELPDDYKIIAGDTRNPPVAYSPEEASKIEKDLSKIKDAKPPSRTTKAAIGALSVVGIWDIACSVKNMIGAAAVAAKIANQMEMIVYAAGISTKVYEMKAGAISPEDAEAIGQFFTETDNRREIPDIGASAADESSPLEMMPNPNYGKNALDSQLYQMSSSGSGVARPSPQFSLGMGQNSLLSGVSATADVFSTITNVGVGGNGTCEVVQHGLTRLIGMVVGGVLAVGSGGAALAGQIALAAGLIAAMATIETILNNALGGSIIEMADLESDTVARGDAMWTGIAGMTGVSAQGRGLMPGTTEQITEYANLRNDVNEKYAEIEREDAHMFDIYNQYSFIGSFARSVINYMPTNLSLSSSLYSLSSIVKSGLSNPFNSMVKASSVIDSSRFSQCDDTAYNGGGGSNTGVFIDADVQCNIRYVMPSKDLALDPEDVALYMERNGYVENDSVTGLPKGYSRIDPKAAQDGLLGFISESADSFMGQFFSSRDYSNDYSKFLDFCAYRVQPFGDTFDDNNPFGGVTNDWKTGKKCMEDSVMLSNFRMYTLYKSIDEALDDDMGVGTISGNIVAPLKSGSYNITFGFGPREKLCDNCSTWHAALDMMADITEPVLAIGSGEVIQSGIGGKGGQGVRCSGAGTGESNNVVLIRLDNGVVAHYYHMGGKDITVNVGDRVTPGQVIGKVNNCGDSRGSHLHIEIQLEDDNNPNFPESKFPRSGNPSKPRHIDPALFFQAYGITL